MLSWQFMSWSRYFYVHFVVWHSKMTSSQFRFRLWFILWLWHSLSLHHISAVIFTTEPLTEAKPGRCLRCYSYSSSIMLGDQRHPSWNRSLELRERDCYLTGAGLKLDGVGPVDNRPSTDKLHHFVQRKKERKKLHVTRDMWQVTPDTWHVTCDTWHVTCDMWHIWGGEHSLKISAS